LSSTPLAVAAALGSTVVFGMSSVAEQRGTKLVKRRRALSPRIFLDLARQPLWVASIGGILIGFTLQVVALKFGELALVEPLLVCDLIFASLINSYLRKRWDPVMFGGVIACAAGVAGFLIIARPSGGRTTVSFDVVLPLAAGLAAALAGCLVLARRSRDVRPLALALACGICYGTSAFLVKVLTAQFGSGLPAVLTNWPIYALAVVAPAGFLLQQNAFQQGTLLAPVLAITTACDPIISIFLAWLWLNERLTSSPAAIAGQVLALLLMVTGIVVLAHHSPMAIRQLEQSASRAKATPAQDVETRSRQSADLTREVRGPAEGRRQAGAKRSRSPSLRSTDRNHSTDAPIPAAMSATVATVHSSRNVAVGSVASSTARHAASSRKTPAQSHVAPWKKRCRLGWWAAGCRRAIISVASWAQSGFGPRAVRANRMHRQRFASGKCTRKINRLPVARTTPVCMESTIAEMASRPGTDPVANLRMTTVIQVAPSPASSPAVRPPSHAAIAKAATGIPSDSLRLHAMTRRSWSGRGSSRCSAIHRA
jgi:drug/metabolite transporter (DMT)-like permease